MKIRLAKEIAEKFYKDKKNKLFLVIFLSLIASIFEYLGLFLIFEFIVILSDPSSMAAVFAADVFEKYMGIDDFSYVSLCVGICVALIYIFKNIYMYFFTRINSEVFQDLSVAIALKTVKNLLFSDFVKVNKIPNAQKQATILKTDILVWGYLIQYINLIVNIAIIFVLITFLLIHFTYSAIIALGLISVLCFIEYKILKHKSNFQNKYYTMHYDALSKVVYTIINGSKEIRLSNKSGYFFSQAKEKYKNLACMNKKTCVNNVFHIYFTEISIMTTFIAILFVMYFTSNFSNQTVIVTLGATIAVVLRITPAINRAQSSIYGINSNEKIASDILDFNNQFGEFLNCYETDKKLPFNNNIELVNVSYNYPESDVGLKNINLKINKGEFIGIVGRSGCYKTTLSLIIAGLLKPTFGNIILDGEILEGKKYNEWQNNIAILSQDFSILKDDIYDGLSKEIIEKLELQGLNSNPLLLSFGQKQRAAFAQKISQNKEVIILDEATSSLDVLSEDKINNLLLELKGKRTIISIAHRLQILKHCDRIIYMDKGIILDTDSFINLNNKYPEFRKMIELSNIKL